LLDHGFFFQRRIANVDPRKAPTNAVTKIRASRTSITSPTDGARAPRARRRRAAPRASARWLTGAKSWDLGPSIAALPALVAFSDVRESALLDAPDVIATLAVAVAPHAISSGAAGPIARAIARGPD